MKLMGALNLALVCVLVWLWVDSDGELRNVKWVPPVAIKPNLSPADQASVKLLHTDMLLALATLERPLFSSTRRPPPPTEASIASPEPARDPLRGVVILGIFSGIDVGGIIATVDGVRKRVSVNGTIADWTLKAIDNRDVRFERNGESRVISLLRSQPTATSEATAIRLPAATAQQNTPNQVANAPVDAIRDRYRRRNEMRVKAGLLPVPLP